MGLLDGIGEIAIEALGSLLPRPADIAGRTIAALLVGTASFTASAVGTFHLVSAGPPWIEPDWAFETVMSAAVGGVFAFVVGLACWSKAEEARAVPAVAAMLGLASILLFPVVLGMSR